MKVGIDLIKVERIRKIANNLNSAKKIFNAEELDYIESKKSTIKDDRDKLYNHAEQTMSGIFAAKESVLKALGIGINQGIGFKDVSILHNELGAPVAKISKNAEKTAKLNKKYEISVNISHDGEYATAICIISWLFSVKVLTFALFCVRIIA